jgi:hypothetical protein
MMAVEKDAVLRKNKTLFPFSTATTTKLASKFHQGLLRREEDETTAQRRAGKPGRSNASLVTEGFQRTDTRASSSSARRKQFSTKRPDTFTRTVPSPTSNLLQFGGGPYI